MRSSVPVALGTCECSRLNRDPTRSVGGMVRAGTRHLPEDGRSDSSIGLCASSLDGSLESGGEGAIYLGDICPATTHVRSLWCTAYDLDLIATRHQKTVLLNQAAENNWWVLWDHDHQVAASRVAKKKNDFAIVDPRAVL